MSAQLSIEDIFTLSPTQRSLFDAGAANSTSGLSNLQQFGYRISGSMVPDNCRKAWQAVMDAHPGLRSSFHRKEGHSPFQVVHNHITLPFSFTDLRGLSPEEQQEKLDEFLTEDARECFLYATAPMLRVALHQLGEDQFFLTLTIDHLIYDGWSLGVAFKNFIEAYGQIDTHGEASLPVFPSVKSYNNWLKNKDLKPSIEWCRKRMSGARRQRIPFARAITQKAEGEADNMHFLFFSEEEDQRINQGARRQGVTPNIIFQGTWALLLSRCHEDRKAVFGAGAVSRPDEIPDIDKMFGMLVDVLPYNTECPGNMNSADWLKSLHSDQLDALEHPYIPLQDLSFFGERPEDHPISTYIVYENVDTGETDSDPVGPFMISGAHMYVRLPVPLSIMGLPSPVLRIAFIFSPHVIVPEDMERLSGLFHEIMLLLAERSDLTLDEICEAAGLNVPLLPGESGLPPSCQES